MQGTTSLPWFLFRSQKTSQHRSAVLPLHSMLLLLQAHSKLEVRQFSAVYLQDRISHSITITGLCACPKLMVILGK